MLARDPCGIGSISISMNALPARAGVMVGNVVPDALLMGPKVETCALY